MLSQCSLLICWLSFNSTADLFFLKTSLENAVVRGFRHNSTYCKLRMTGHGAVIFWPSGTVDPYGLCFNADVSAT